MDTRTKIGAGLLGAVGAVAGSMLVLSAGKLVDAALDRNTTAYARKAFTAQPCGLPPFPAEDPAIRAKMEANSIEMEERVNEWYYRSNIDQAVILTDSGTIRLVGKIFYADRPSNNWVILAHSYRGTSREMEKFALMYSNHGFNVLNVDLRAHGESEGSLICMGWQDGQDILEWVGYLTARFGSDINVVLHGQSMGAASVVNASGWCTYPQVKAIVADSCYASFRDVAMRILRKLFLPPAEPLYAGMRLGNLARGSFDFNKNNPAKTVTASRIPALFIHGALDSLVPSVSAAELYSACNAESKRLHITPDAGHRASVFVDPAAYEAIVFEFLAKIGILR